MQPQGQLETPEKTKKGLTLREPAAPQDSKVSRRSQGTREAGTNLLQKSDKLITGPPPPRGTILLLEAHRQSLPQRSLHTSKARIGERQQTESSSSRAVVVQEGSSLGSLGHRWPGGPAASGGGLRKGCKAVLRAFSSLSPQNCCVLGVQAAGLLDGSPRAGSGLFSRVGGSHRCL